MPGPYRFYLLGTRGLYDLVILLRRQHWLIHTVTAQSQYKYLWFYVAAYKISVIQGGRFLIPCLVHSPGTVYIRPRICSV